MRRVSGITAALWWLAGTVTIAERAEPVRPSSARENLSLRLEIQHRIDRGVAWLLEEQDPERGSWGSQNPEMATGWALTALGGNPAWRKTDVPQGVEAGFRFLFRRLRLAESGEAAPLEPEDWLAVLPALYNRSEDAEPRHWISVGIGVLKEAARDENGVQAREILQSAGQLGFLGPKPEWLDLPVSTEDAQGTSALFAWRIRAYRQGTVDAGDTASRPAMETWVREQFAVDVADADVPLLGAMALALVRSGVRRVPDAHGGKVDWREKLAVRLFDLQEWSGPWPAEEGGEDAVLMATCRALLALETIMDAL